MLVFSLGLMRSASTWTFNVIRALMADQDAAAFSIFCETAAGLAQEMPPQAVHAVLKCHYLEPTLLRIAKLSGSPVVATVRDPRDAVLSLVESLEYDYRDAITAVGRGLAAIGTAAQQMPVRILWYEDGFFADRGTVETIAGAIGIPVAPDRADRIFDSLQYHAVEQRIAAARTKPTADGGAPHARDVVDDASQWHFGHLGDTATGKWQTRIPQPWQRCVDSYFGPFARDRSLLPREEIGWDPLLFHREDGTQPDDPWCFAARGPANYLVRGPYLHLPQGRWQFVVDLEITGLTGHLGVIVNVHNGVRPLAANIATLRRDGRVAVEMIADHCDYSRALRVCLILEKPAPTGSIRFQGCRCRRLADADDTASYQARPVST